MKNFLLPIMMLLTSVGFAQTPSPTRADLLKAQESRVIYPLFKGGILSGILPAGNVTMPYTAKGTCKIFFDFAVAAPDPAQPHPGLDEVMRILNLHVAAGVPPNKLDVYLVYHGPGAASFLNNENYNKRFKQDNPNLAHIKQLQEKGVKLVVCGQTLELRGLKMTSFPEGILKAYSAITARSDLQSQGYTLYNIEESH